MTPQEFESQLIRLSVVCQRCWTEHDAEVRARWIEELREFFQPLEAAVWTEAVTAVVRSHTDPRLLPTPAKLREAYDAAELRRKRDVNKIILETRFIDGRAHYYLPDGTEWMPR